MFWSFCSHRWTILWAITFHLGLISGSWPLSQCRLAAAITHITIIRTRQSALLLCLRSRTLLVSRPQFDYSKVHGRRHQTESPKVQRYHNIPQPILQTVLQLVSAMLQHGRIQSHECDILPACIPFTLMPERKKEVSCTNNCKGKRYK